MVNIALISGSLRAGSANTAVLRAAAAHLADQDGVSVTEVSIGDLPLYDEDVEAAGWPEAVQAMRDKVAGADALMISTPEYNGSIPGGLKNALDWLSRPHGAGVLDGRLVATVSASPSPYGAKWAQDHLRHVLDRSSARLANAEEVTVPQAFDVLDEAGEIAEPQVLATIRDLADEVRVAAQAQASGV